MHLRTWRVARTARWNCARKRHRHYLGGGYWPRNAEDLGIEPLKRAGARSTGANGFWHWLGSLNHYPVSNLVLIVQRVLVPAHHVHNTHYLRAIAHRGAKGRHLR